MLDASVALRYIWNSGCGETCLKELIATDSSISFCISKTRKRTSLLNICLLI